MPFNYILNREETRKVKEEGAKILFDTVSSTLGPRGNEVGFFAAGDMAMAIHDGVEVARRVVVEDPGHMWAIKTILQSANKTVSSVGDGTTLTTILSYEIFHQAMSNIIAGAKPRALVDDLLKNKDKLIEEIKKVSIPLKKIEQAIGIASISAQDPKLGKDIGEIVFKMGVDGVVTTDISDTGETYIDFQEGCQFENGYMSPYFVTDPSRGEATVENPRILLTDKNLNNINELAPLLKQFEEAKEPNIVIIAQDIGGSALESAILTKVRGGMNVICIRAPYAGQVQKDFLDDIAIMTGGVVISQQQGRSFQNVRLNELGQAKRVTSTDIATLIVGGRGDKFAVEKRITDLKTLLAEKPMNSDYQTEKLKERIAKLSTGIAVVKVGAPLEIEQKNYMERAKDAVRATTAAMKDGYVPGGETIYFAVREALDQTLGGRILYNAIEKPYRVLLENAGLAPDRFIDRIKDGYGVDVIDGQVKKMIESQIVDPTAVSIEAITNAVSAAISLFTTETLILPKIEEKKNG